MRTLIEKAANRTANALTIALAVLLICGILISVVNVSTRYIWGFTYRGGDEIQVYIMVMMTFVGAGIVSWRNQHLRLDLLSAAAPKPVGTVLNWFERGLALLVCGFVLWVAWSYTARVFGFGMRSDTAGIPLWIPHSALVAGFALICIGYLSVQLEDPTSKVANTREH